MCDINSPHFLCLCHFFRAPSGFPRQAWALVSVVGGGNGSCVEEVREHENHDTGGRALARRNFTTVDGVGFSVAAYSEWKNGEDQHKMEKIQNHSERAFVLVLFLCRWSVCDAVSLHNDRASARWKPSSCSTHI